MSWFLLFVLFISTSYAHQSSMTEGGRVLYWPNPNVPIYIRTNTSDLDPITVTNIVQNSMNEWNLTGAVNIMPVGASSNEVRFSSDFAIYGSAVIGLTEISYNTSGAISKAIILLNDSYTFTSQQNSFGAGRVYLGDVVTHELGHFFGLSHSEVLNSSMFYTSFPGQSTLSADDRSGIKQKYHKSQGSIRGTVKGGNHIGVLGVHVQAISRRTGESVGVITDENGSFTMEGLDQEDTYFIYTSPLKHVESLPAYFANVQKEFCPGTYSGSFFSACGREYEGYPQGITLRAENAKVDVGVITINCGLKASEDYSYQKLQSSFAPVTIWAPEEGALREKAFVGYFAKMSTSSWSSWETLKVDLSGVPASSNRMLRINFVAHPFGNLLEYEMRLQKFGNIVATSGMTISGLLGTYNTDMSQIITLSQNPNENVYEVQVRARKLGTSLVPLTFPSSSLFTSDSHLPYILIAGISDGATPLFNSEAFLSDNESCLDAPFTYKVSKTKTLSEKIPISDSDPAKAAFSCATIEPPRGGGPGGLFGVSVLGFSLALITGSLGKKAKNILS